MEQRKSIILVFNKYYLPGYRAGGPIRTLENMVEALGEEFDFRIVTLNRDLGADHPYEGINKGVWYALGKAKVAYQDPLEVSIRLLLDVVLSVRPDVIYLNSFFDSTFTQRILWARRMGWLDIPIVLAPRGEFSRGALGIKKIKKSAYIAVTRFIRLYRNIVWHASSEYEHKDILSAIKDLKGGYVEEARNIATLRDKHIQLDANKEHKENDDLYICFLSRISPKKNLAFALRVLQLVKVRVNFVIYGPVEDEEYWQKCKNVINSIPKNVTVAYHGEVQPSEIKNILSRYDLFFFPTLGENYGHVIHEALSSGVPVLISDQTPWDDIEIRNVGWARSLTSPRIFSEIIESYAKLTSERRYIMSQKAIGYAYEKSKDSRTFDSNVNLFRNLIFRHKQSSVQ